MELPSGPHRHVNREVIPGLFLKDFKEHVAELLSNLGPNNDVVIQDAGKPIARLISIHDTPPQELPQKNAPRPLGLFKGKMWIAPDFNDELPEDFWCPPDDPLTK